MQLYVQNAIKTVRHNFKPFPNIEFHKASHQISGDDVALPAVSHPCVHLPCQFGKARPSLRPVATDVPLVITTFLLRTVISSRFWTKYRQKILIWTRFDTGARQLILNEVGEKSLLFL